MEVILVLSGIIAFIAAFVSIGNLKRRVAELESALRAQQLRVRPPGDDAPTERHAPPPESTPEKPDPQIHVAVPVASETADSRSNESELDSAGGAAPSQPAVRPPPLPPRLPSAPSQRDASAFESKVKAWFSEGNVPVKVGMLVLLAGVAALLKYASDAGWLHAPIELRLAGVSAAALAGIVFGWRKREQKRVFALSLQGGSIGVLLLTVFAAFKLYGLLPASAAFALSVALVAGLCVLAVTQNAMALAVLGVSSGFLAPLWLSTGEGNHVVLFSYYALLNAAVFAIAWWRPWRALNLLGFAFTFAIGTSWGGLHYDATRFATTEPFLLLFFAFYLLIPLFEARRRKPIRGDKLSGGLVFGTPLIAFSLQAALLEGDEMPLAFCALALAAIYASLARGFIRRERYLVLAEAWAILAVGFATLAVPLALSARATASLFALEGAALVWLGLRQRRRLPQLTGVLLQLAAGVAFFVGLSASGAELSFPNATFVSGVLLAISGVATAWQYWVSTKRLPAVLAYLWALGWWLATGVHEIDRFVAYGHQADAVLVFVAVTAWVASEIHRRREMPETALTTVGGFLAAIPVALAQARAHHHPFAGWGGLAWAGFAILGVRSLLNLRANSTRFAVWAQFVWWLVWPSALSLVADWACSKFELQSGWTTLLVALPWLAFTWVSLRRWAWLSKPLGERFDSARTWLAGAYFIRLGFWWLTSLFQNGSSAPLPWLPVLNPMELAQAAVLSLLAVWLWSPKAPSALASRRALLLSLAGFVTLSFIPLRVVHHYADVSWSLGILSSAAAQMALTVVWSILGVVGWIVGSRRGHRAAWLGSALLMGVVLLKLVVVDRHHLGNLPGIASFIAYGLLCTLVGYFAPAPPRDETSVAKETHE